MRTPSLSSWCSSPARRPRRHKAPTAIVAGGGLTTPTRTPMSSRFAGSRFGASTARCAATPRRWRSSTARLGPDGITFVVTHVRPDGRTAYQDKASARIEGDRLIVTGTSGAPRGGKFQRTLLSRCARARSAARSRAVAARCHRKARDTCGARRSRRGTCSRRAPRLRPVAHRLALRRHWMQAPAPAAAPPGAGARGRGWLQPGPWKNPLTIDDVVGAWIGFGTGVNKQYFIFRRVGNGLRGMVCGRCDNPFTLAALDDIEIRGDTLRFKILHDGWGDAPVAAVRQMGDRPHCRQRNARRLRNAGGGRRPRSDRDATERRRGHHAHRSDRD